VAHAPDSLPDDIATLKAMLVAERAARLAAEAKAHSAEAKAHARALEIEKLKFAIAKLRHRRFGQSAERGALIEQLELQLADLEETAAEAEASAEIATKTASADAIQVRGFERKKPSRSPLPDYLPRERIVYPAPSACRAAAACCASWART
jgi:transposase